MKQASNSVSALAYAVVLGGLWLAAPVRAATHPLGWGLNANFQASPVPTNVMDDASAIAAGYYHSLAIKNGRVWAWGLNTSGQTNVPVAAQSGVTNVAGGSLFSLALKTNGAVVGWGVGAVVTNAPSSITSGVSQISAGEFHALALKDGGVIAWGSNQLGQCDVPVELASGVSNVAAGGHFGLALKEGAVHVFGVPATNEYAYGIRDVPAEALSGVTAIAAGRWHALALKEGGVIAWGAPFFDATNVPAEATSDVSAIAAGDCFSLALKTDGTIVFWGDDTKGQIPIPNYASNGVSRIAAGVGHCLAVCTAMPPRFVAFATPDAYRDILYSNGYVRAAGDPAVRYSATGSWPAWLTLDPDTGDLGGTPLEIGISYFSVIASNSFGRVTNSYQVNVQEKPLGPPIFLSTSPLSTGVVGAAYSHQIVITNSGTFSLVSGEGDLPGGLSLSTNGLVSGIPTTVETRQFTVRATNVVGGSNKVYAITIDPPAGPPAFTTTNPLSYGLVDQPYSFQIEAENYPTFSLESGALPEGLGLTASGLITGTPVQVESANFTVFATNLVGSTNATYDLDVFGPPVFTTESPLPDGAVDAAYSAQIEANYADSFERVGGSWPTGIGLTAAGAVTGTPVSAGTFNVTIRATNDYGWSNRTFDLLIAQVPVFSTTNPLPTGQVGTYYSKLVEASGTPTFSVVAGTLPGGLDLDGGGLLSGTPTASGDFNFTVRATNDYGWSNRTFDVTILGQLAPSFTERPRYTNGGVRLAWTNPNAAGNVQVWMATNIVRVPPPWTNLGVQNSPWTNAAPPTPSYYRLILVP